MTKVYETYGTNAKRAGFIKALEMITFELKSEPPKSVILHYNLLADFICDASERLHCIYRLTGRKIFFFFKEQEILLEVIGGNVNQNWVLCRVHDAETHAIAKPILTEFSEKYGVNVTIEKAFND